MKSKTFNTSDFDGGKFEAAHPGVAGRWKARTVPPNEVKVEAPDNIAFQATYMPDGPPPKPTAEIRKVLDGTATAAEHRRVTEWQLRNQGEK